MGDVKPRNVGGFLKTGGEGGTRACEGRRGRGGGTQRSAQKGGWARGEHPNIQIVSRAAVVVVV